MALVVFQNNSAPYLNADNLNNNFNELKPYVLYNNSGGSSGTITLSDSINNYSYFEIVYSRYGFLKSTGRINIFGSVALNGFFAYYDENAQQIIWQNYVEMVTMNGQTITRDDTYYTNAGSSSFINSGTFSGGVMIHTVIGYK